MVTTTRKTRVTAQVMHWFLHRRMAQVTATTHGAMLRNSMVSTRAANTVVTVSIFAGGAAVAFAVPGAATTLPIEAAPPRFSASPWFSPPSWSLANSGVDPVAAGSVSESSRWRRTSNSPTWCPSFSETSTCPSYDSDSGDSSSVLRLEEGSTCAASFASRTSVRTRSESGDRASRWRWWGEVRPPRGVRVAGSGERRA